MPPGRESVVVVADAVSDGGVDAADLMHWYSCNVGDVLQAAALKAHRNVAPGAELHVWAHGWRAMAWREHEQFMPAQMLEAQLLGVVVASRSERSCHGSMWWDQYPARA